MRILSLSWAVSGLVLLPRGAAADAWSLNELLRRIPPLAHDASGRLPLITWEAFRIDAGDDSFRRHEALPAEMYRELARRGLTQRLPLDVAYIPMALAIQNAGAKVAIVEGESGNGPAGQVPGGLHELAAGKARYPCPLLLAGWRRRADRIRTTLAAFQEAGVRVDAAWLDWEVEPYGGEPQWQEARACTRCRSMFPAGVLEDSERYRALIARWRGAVLSAYVAAPILETYPRCSTTNWQAVVSTAEAPTPGWAGDGTLPPQDLGLFSAANPVVYGDTFLFRHHWRKQWPVDSAHMDRVYTHVMLGQISGHAASAGRQALAKQCVPWVVRYCPDDPDPTIPMLSRERYREILRHVWLRGADAMQVFNALRRGHEEIAGEEVEDAVAVLDEMLGYRRFLDAGVPMNTDVPAVDDDGPVWSGRRLGNEALVRVFTQGTRTIKARLALFDDAPPLLLDCPPGGASYVLSAPARPRAGRSGRPVPAPRASPSAPAARAAR